MKNWRRVTSASFLTALMAIGNVVPSMAATTDNSISQREKDNAALAREVATEGMVLLRNDEQALPIKGKNVALFGNSAIRTIRGGTGSGDPFNGGLSGGGDVMVDLSERYNINIYNAFVENGCNVTSGDFLEEFAKGYDEAKLAFGSNPMSTFAYPEMELTQDVIDQAKKETDTAIYVIARNAGEGADRSATTKSGSMSGENGETINFEVGDYELTDLEKANLALVGKNFDKVAVVLNVGGVIDTKFMDEIEGLDALLNMSQAGQESGTAAFDILTGAVTPSGKLTSTWAKDYSDYPASDTFGANDGDELLELYNEGIYVGYRYFDTFNITPAYEFGYGMSYTDFNIAVDEVEANEDKVTVEATVTNIGDTYSGKEVVEVYYSAPDSDSAEKAYQELAGFAKTDVLAPGESQTLTITYETESMAYYNTEEAAYVLDAGDYVVRVGNSSRNTEVAAVISLDEAAKTKQLSNQMGDPYQYGLNEISKENTTPYGYEGEAEEIANAEKISINADNIECVESASQYDDEKVYTYTSDPEYKATQPYEEVVYVEDKSDATLLDVYNGDVSLEEFVAKMSLEEMATLNCGSGWGVANENDPVVGSSSDTVPGAAGETTVKYFDTHGIPSIVVADGPGGIRVKQEYEATDVNTGEVQTYYQYCTAWPVSVLRGQTWNKELLEEVGRAFATELKEMGITVVLGPSLNIHRDPLCGRNFEYYSEDPLISGIMAGAETNGVQETPGVGACLKHYALNNQEASRNTSNSVASERTMREIYLKGFEIAVESSRPMTVMTSYNLINGVPAADSYDLCTDILRGEWDFEGMVMTDWNGGSSTPRISMHAGNDMIMPGGPSRAQNIIGGASTIVPEFDENGQVSLKENLNMMFTYQEASWGEFTVDASGTDTVVAQLGDGYEATVDENGNILVNGEVIYSKYVANIWGGEGYFTDPVTTAIASVSDDGKQITYRGTYLDDNTICLGDVQKSAINNLKVIINSIAMESFYGSDKVTLEPWAANMSIVDYMTATKSEVTSVNKTALQIAVDVASNITDEELENVVPAVANELKAALEEAKAILEDATAEQETVDASFDRLATAIQMLDFIKGDKAALRSFITKVENAVEEEYTPATWTAFAAALETGNTVLADENAMQEEVDNAYTNLVKAYLNLRLVPNKDKLEDLINQTKALVAANYTADTWENVSNALVLAENVMSNENATSEEVTNAETVLTKAVEGLVVSNTPVTPSTPAVDNTVDSAVKTPVNNGDTTASVKTGDESLTGLFGGITLLSLAGAVLLKRKEN